MKRFVCVLFVLVLFPLMSCADLPDISGLSFDELVELKDQINLAIWNSQEWQEVTVPIGVWEIGKDIPAGYWTIKAAPEMLFHIWYGDVLNESGTGAGLGWDGFNGLSEVLSSRTNKDGSWKYPEDPSEINIKMVSGWYFLNDGPVIFTPYSGKPDLGFK